METDWGPLEQFWKRWGGAALQVALRLTYRRDADDLVSDAMLRLTRRYALRPLEPNALWPYLCKILANLAIDRHRKQHFIECEYVERVDVRNACDEYRNGEGDRIAVILATVREPYRSTMICADILEMSHEDTAQTLGITKGTVRSRLHRGRAMARPAAEKMLEERRKG